MQLYALLDFWLVSFLICVNYSVGIPISYLRFLCLKCLLIVGETQYCDYYVWIIVYMLCISVFQMFMIYYLLWFHEVCTLLSTNCTTKTLEKPILLYCIYWDCVSLFSRSLGTISSNNIFFFVTWQKPRKIKTTFLLPFHFFGKHASCNTQKILASQCSYWIVAWLDAY